MMPIFYFRSFGASIQQWKRQVLSQVQREADHALILKLKCARPTGENPGWTSGGDSTKNQRRPRNGGLKHMKWNEEMPGWGSLGWRIVKELSIFNMKLQWMKLSVLIRGTGHWTQSVSALYLLCSLMLHVRQFLCHWPVSTKKMAWC